MAVAFAFSIRQSFVVECMNLWQALVGILSSDSHRLIRKGRGEGSFQRAHSAGKAETLFVPGKFPSISDGAPVSGDAAGKNGQKFVNACPGP